MPPFFRTYAYLHPGRRACQITLLREDEGMGNTGMWRDPMHMQTTPRHGSWWFNDQGNLVIGFNCFGATSQVRWNVFYPIVGIPNAWRDQENQIVMMPYLPDRAGLIPQPPMHCLICAQPPSPTSSAPSRTSSYIVVSPPASPYLRRRGTSSSSSGSTTTTLIWV